jgi:hypothetical protein
MVQPKPLEWLEVESATLAADFPPVLRDRNKQVVQFYRAIHIYSCFREK